MVMTVYELNREQLTQLKTDYLMKEGAISWDEIANANELVTDEEIYTEFEGVYFVPGDFSN